MSKTLKKDQMVTEEQMTMVTKERTVEATIEQKMLYIWTDDETELVLKQQPMSSTGSQILVNMLTFGAQYCTVNVEEGNWKVVCVYFE